VIVRGYVPLALSNRTAQPDTASGEIMKTDEMRELPASNEAGRSAVTAREEAYHRCRLLATMVQGTASALPEAWQS
jgi:hypothetical protein